MRNGSLLSRTAALLLLVLGVWAVWSAIESPLLASVSADRGLIAQASLLAGAHGDQAVLQAARRRALDRFVEARSWSLDGSSPELLSAQLQRSIDSYAGASGASVASSRTMASQPSGGLTKIGLDFELHATLPSLQTLLARIDGARPPIFVDRLTVQVAEGGAGAQDGELGVALHVAIYASSRRAQPAL